MSPSRRAVAWSSVAGVAVVGAAVTAVFLVGPPGASRAADAQVAAGTTTRPTTAVVEQGTLTGTTTRAGRLSRLDGPTVTGSAPGTITSLPKVGDALSARSELFRVDDEPVTAFEGALPQWRAFEQGMAKGPDVRQVEENLKAWGYFTGTPDDRFDRRTATAVSAWQKDTGQERTGSIARGALQFVTGSFTVSTLTAAVGDASGGDLYDTARDDKVVSVDLPVGSPLAAVDGVVSVALPGHGTVPGRVSDVGAAVADETAGTTTVPVTVSLDDPVAAGDLTDASVQVDFVSEVKEDVLHVPVLALGAAVDDGFVVEVLQPDGTTTAVPVEAGLFAGDRVEVTGDVRAGDEVVVPA
ncbi:peptidoglycan-binding protein [Frigoribacterium sp. CFBP 8759]|uniref:peptidoglycan-binding protein n=1 Tax=Frigoribacterium sp. CFBP 8759 TaxID=2775283 RepID=UPI001783E55D|nr:peptidoglycan-binding protein [Frigoribacterium sp. CFBP 8759]